MPIFSVSDAEKLSPLFKGKRGRFLFRAVGRITALDRVNRLHDRVEATCEPGPDFAEGLLEDIGIDYLVGNSERLSELPEGAFITISNHVHGHIDGIMLVDMIGHRRPEMKVMVNRILMHIRGLSPNFIAVVPTGAVRTAPTADSINGIKQALLQVRSGGPLALFPSGAVSDLKLKGGVRIEDRDWQDAIIKLIAKARVPIVPIRFLDRNSAFFYGLGLLDWRIRLIRLCHEVFNKRGKRIRLAIGETIGVAEQDRFRGDPAAFKEFLRSSVYDMPVPGHFTPRSDLHF